MNLLVPLLGVYTSVLLFMFVLSFILYRNNPNLHLKNLLKFWTAIVALFIWVTVTSEAPLNIVATNLILWYWNLKMMIVILGDSCEMDLWRPWYFPVVCVGYAISGIAFILNLNFYWLTVPAILGFDAMMFYAVYLVWKRWKELSVFNKALWFCILSFSIHMNDYPWDRQMTDSKVLIFAFIYFVFNILAFAITLPMVVLDNINRETNRKLEGLVRERSEQLIQQSKMTSLGQMAGGVAHEINNPLAIITAGISAVEKTLEENKSPGTDFSRAQFFLDKITRGSQRIDDIVKSLKTYSLEEKGETFTRQSLQKIVADTTMFYGEKLKNAGVELKLPNLEGTPYLIYVDPPLAAQVILNLISNSLDAVAPLKEKWIQIEMIKRKDSIILSVIDSGSGMPPSIVTKIFDPFFTTKEVGKGTGLGLSTAKGIMKSLGGDLAYDSASPHTKFDIIFPA